MIYLRNTTEAQVAMIPRNGEEVAGDMSLVMRNTTDNQDLTVSILDLHTSGIYFNLAVVLPEGLADGEYQYEVRKGEIRLSCGLLYLGDLRSPSQYEESIKYQQYESD